MWLRNESSKSLSDMSLCLIAPRTWWWKILSVNWKQLKYTLNQFGHFEIETYSQVISMSRSNIKLSMPKVNVAQKRKTWNDITEKKMLDTPDGSLLPKELF